MAREISCISVSEGTGKTIIDIEEYSEYAQLMWEVDRIEWERGRGPYPSVGESWLQFCRYLDYKEGRT